MIYFSFFRLYSAENFEAHQIIDCVVIQRNGKDYVKMNGARTTVKFSDFSFKAESDSVNPFVVDIVNRIVNANFDFISRQIDVPFCEYTGEVIESILTPIFDNIPIQNFFQ